MPAPNGPSACQPRGIHIRNCEQRGMGARDRLSRDKLLFKPATTADWVIINNGQSVDQINGEMSKRERRHDRREVTQG